MVLHFLEKLTQISIQITIFFINQNSLYQAAQKDWNLTEKRNFFGVTALKSLENLFSTMLLRSNLNLSLNRSKTPKLRFLWGNFYNFGLFLGSGGPPNYFFQKPRYFQFRKNFFRPKNHEKQSNRCMAKSYISGDRHTDRQTDIHTETVQL